MAQKAKIQKFNSINEFTAYLNSGRTNPNWPSYHYMSERNSERFAGTADYETADRLLQYGDDRSFAALKDAGLQVTNTTATQYKRTIYSSVVGALPNVPAYVAGAPNSMIAQKRVAVAKKVVNICYDISFACDIPAATITKIGVALVNQIRKIEASGQRCNLYISFAPTIEGNNYGLFLKIKDAGQSFDLKKLAYPLVNPSMLRRHFFRYIEVTEGIPYAPTYGTSVVDTEKLRNIYGAYLDNMLLVHGGYIATWRDHDIEKAVEDALTSR